MRYYLNLAELLSQIWLDRHVILIVLLILKIFLFTRLLMAALKANQILTKQLCEAMNDLLNLALLLPEQISQVVNIVLGSVMENLQEIIIMLLNLSISILKGLIAFMINLYLGTLACLCTAFVKGALDILVDVTKLIVDAVDEVVNTVLSLFNSAMGALGTLIDGMIKAYEAVASLFSSKDSSSVTTAILKVNLTISALHDISIPTTFIDVLTNLSNDIPDFEDLLADLAGLVTHPLDLLSYEIGNLTSFSSLGLSEIRNVSYNSLTNTCNEIDLVFEKTMRNTTKLSNTVILGLGLAILLVLALISWLTYLGWNRKKRIIEELTVELNHIRIGNILTKNRIVFSLFNVSDPRLKWILNYITTPVALSCFLLGAAGLGAVGLQYLVLCVVGRQFKNLLKDFNANSVVQDLLLETVNYLNETLHALQNLLDQANTKLFGSITTASTKLYNTLVEAEVSVNDTISQIFGSTPFASPLRTVVYCTIGRKLDKIEDGLNWISENLQIPFPTLTHDDLQEIANLGVTKSVSATSDIASFVAESIQALVKSYKQVLKTELIAACAFFGIWIVIVVVGLMILIVREFTEEEAVQHDISMPRPITDAEREFYKSYYSDPFKITDTSRYSDII